MKKIAAFAAAVFVTTMAGVVRVGAESPLALTVRLYDASGIPSAELLAARRTAEPILRDAGMEVTFRQCGRAGSPGALVDPCDDSLKPSEVVVRVITAPVFSSSLDPHAYGVTYVVEESNRGWLATLFSDRIAGAASRVDLEPGTLLGRVLAHEVGHLLIGNSYHGDAGVMRAEWSDDLLQRGGAEEWRFSMFEAKAIQRALASGSR
jgi:hypothetical protein